MIDVTTINTFYLLMCANNDTINVVTWSILMYAHNDINNVVTTINTFIMCLSQF